ncbi:MAG: hypothetical protein B9J98_06800 [Candidatus Terraquivivens tikiterensis]|uniref:Thiamine-phosphate synthase ThiN domain-containing protein n=1 Tax=Candidatus Terraquivivens tikiterensis TaxID=1980982 RepID=A0A2R7Y1H9_9ARCH|nr:MAG: hypothetical protein B9J98_06800 [Candidatus Terraquivivens tikiterensis]
MKYYAREKGWMYAGIDRMAEPDEVRLEDGKSMPWKVKSLLRECGGKIPRLFYERPGISKEPLTVLLGKDAVEVAMEADSISKRYAAFIKR